MAKTGCCRLPEHVVVAAILLLCVLMMAVTAAVGSGGNDRLERPREWDIPYVIHDYKNHTCRRPCEGSEPMVCRYYFFVEHYTILGAACGDCPRNKSHCSLPQCVPGNGMPRDILTVNRMMPGPDVDVCEGDTIEVLVDNRMVLGEGTSIHWHGMKQRHSQHMDGTALLTQCPIHTFSTFTYRFKADDPGTHYWHGHSSMQRALGLFGRLKIRQAKSKDPHGHLYDYDLPEHFVLLSDWVGKEIGYVFVHDYFDGARGLPTSLLVNGVGTQKGGHGQHSGPEMPLNEFHVEKGKRYRFRVLTSGILNCPVYMSIDHHKLTVIASDGQNVKPKEVDQIVILSGERYDFVLHANQDGRQNYWVRFLGRGRCMEMKGAVAKSILRYNTAPSDELPPGSNPNKDNTYGEGLVLNGMNYKEKGDVELVQVPDLDSLHPNPDADLTSKPADHVHYLSMGASKIVDKRFNRPALPGQTPRPVRPTNHQLNYITSRMPPAPLLTESDAVSRDMFCNNYTVTKDCSKDMCECVHLYPYKLGDVIEFVMVSFSLTNIHPMHMHGHSYTVTYQQDFHRDITVDEVKEMDRQGKLRRRTDAHAPRKDTMGVRGQSVVIIRFRADNPGFWFFHCHIEFHAETGMNMILQEGPVSDMPTPPPGFNKCGTPRKTALQAAEPASRPEYLVDMPDGYDAPEYTLTAGEAEKDHNNAAAADTMLKLPMSKKDSDAALHTDAIPALSLHVNSDDSDSSSSNSGIHVDAVLGVCVAGVLICALVGYSVYRVRLNRAAESYVLLAPTAQQKALAKEGRRRVDDELRRRHEEHRIRVEEEERIRREEMQGYENLDAGLNIY